MSQNGSTTDTLKPWKLERPVPGRVSPKVSRSSYPPTPVLRVTRVQCHDRETLEGRTSVLTTSTSRSDKSHNRPPISPTTYTTGGITPSSDTETVHWLTQERGMNLSSSNPFLDTFTPLTIEVELLKFHSVAHPHSPRTPVGTFGHGVDE